MDGKSKSISVRVLPYLLALWALLWGTGLGFILGQATAERDKAYYMGGFDTCMAIFIYIAKAPKEVASGTCLGYIRGEYTHGWSMQSAAEGWSWEFVSDE